MNFKALTLLLIILATNSVFCQDIVLSGKLVSTKDSIPVCYANIGILNTYLGTISNETGVFEIKINKQNTKDSLVISAIGYKSKIISIKSYCVLSQPILLEAHIYTLREVVVTNNKLTPKDILKVCIKNIPKNYPTRKYSYEVFFREASILDSTYALLTESVANVWDRGYRNNIKKTRFEIREFRKSKDHRNFNWRTSLREWLYEKNGLYGCLKNDRLKIKKRNYKLETYEYYKTLESGAHRFLNEDFIKQMNFKMDSLSYYNNELVYCISYSPKKNRFFTSCTGQIIIIESNKAVIEIHSRVYIDRQKLRKLKKNDGKPKLKEKTITGLINRSFDGTNYSKLIIRYRKNNKKYYLSYIRTQHNGTSSMGTFGGYSDSKKAIQSNFSSNMLYQDNELFVTQIHEKPIKIKWRNRMNKSTELYKLELPYNKSFWDSYSMLVRNPISKKTVYDLSLEQNLEQQFIENGK